MRWVGGGKCFFSHYSLHEKLHFTPVSCLPPLADKMQKKKKKKKRLNFRIPRNFGPPHLYVSGGSEDRGIPQ